MSEREASRGSEELGRGGEPEDRTGVSGAPHGETDLEGGLTPEERKMLASLSGGARPRASAPEVETPEAAEAEEPAVEEPAAGEVEVEEEPLGEPAAGEPVLTEATRPAGAPVTDGPLSPEETEVLERVRDESDRVSRDALPAMFEKEEEGAGEPSAEVVVEAPVAEPAEPAGAEEAAEAVEGEPAGPTDGPAAEEPSAPTAPPVIETGLLGIIARSLDLVNRPFRWVPPVWRMGLGLCAVLLLVTLALVILARMLLGTGS